MSLVVQQSRMLTPYKPTGGKELLKIRLKLQQINGTQTPAPVVLLDGVGLVPTRPYNPLVLGTKVWRSKVEEGIRRIRAAQKNEPINQNPKVIAVIPTYESEENIGLTIESLLWQKGDPKKPYEALIIDLIVVTINGPGESDVAYKSAQKYAEMFSNVVVERPDSLQGHANKGKVNALNWTYMKYIHYGNFDYVLGIDADIEAHEDMVRLLEDDLRSKKTAGGVMARYGFKTPADMEGKSRSLIYGQRHEFAMTGIKHQLRKDTSDILGGQATLFRVEALIKIAAKTEGERHGPWDARSKVEDAQLTRAMQKEGYTTATSRNARAWTGLMYTPATLHKQRRKWQDGHLEDMLRDFRPWLDRQRWRDQFVLGWNLLTRIMFAALLITSITAHMYLFVPLWLVPIGLAIVQSTLVALKVPDRSFQEIVRAILFIPGEIYYLRTLSVWFDSVLQVILNRTRDGWTNQATAESSKKTTAHVAWAYMALAVCLPTIPLLLALSYLPADSATWLLNGLWILLSIMTSASVLGMLYMIMRIIRNFRSLQP